MPTPAAQLLSLIFQRALIGKPDDRVVKVQARDILAAFGGETCKREFGIDAKQIEQTVTNTVENRLSELDAEITQLRDYAAAGFKDAKKMLKGALKEQRDIKTGVLRPKPLVPVLVGKLRMLVAETLDAPRQQEPQQPVTTPVAVVKATPTPDNGSGDQESLNEEEVTVMEATPTPDNSSTAR